MSTFSQKSKGNQQNKSEKSTEAGRKHTGQIDDVHAILRLQRIIGNQAVQRLIQLKKEDHSTPSDSKEATSSAHDYTRIPEHANPFNIKQPKVRVNSPKDRFEKEADEIADQVVQEESKEEGPDLKIQAQAEPQEMTGDRHISEDLKGQLDGSKGSGKSLSDEEREYLEPRLKHDFSNVRVHDDSEAARMNQELGANAFTQGPDIYFGSGKYDSQSDKGKRLLAHELVHVVQQKSMGPDSPIMGDWLEDAVPSQDDFWAELREALGSELDRYLTNFHGLAVQTWINHMNSRGESGAGNLVMNILKTAVGLVPGGGSVASAIMGTAQDIYNYVESQAGVNRVSFNDFVTNHALARTHFSGLISGRTHPAFTAADRLRDEETDENRAEKRTQALRETRRGMASLQNYSREYQSLVRAWVGGSQDSYDTGDWGPEDAGYIYATCNYFHGSSGFANFYAFVDDVERPEGVIATIRQGWEPSGRANLDRLPFAMTVTVNEMRDTGTMRGFRGSGTTRFQKQEGDHPLTFVSGNERLLSAYMALSTRINASHLHAD